MAVIATNESSGNYEKAPVGMQQAVCVFVNDIGNQPGEWQGKQLIRHQVIITWEIAEKMTQGEYEGMPFMLSKFYTLSLAEKANLRKDLESWRGKQFTEDELRGFDLERLIGANCYLNVTSTDKDKRRISAITPLPKGVPLITPSTLTPSAKFMEWIEKERAKAVVVAQSHSDEAPMPNDEDAEKSDVPF